MPTVTVQAQIDTVNRLRVAVTTILDALEDADKPLSVWTSQDYSNTFDAENLAGTPHEGITKDAVANAINSINALKALIAAGHGTNLYKLYWPIR